MNVKLTIEYKGTAYSGWQSQASTPTIQDTITAAIEKVTQQKVNLIGAGRTDAGVHALGQTANFEISHNLSVAHYRDAINYYLPQDIRILSSEAVQPDFNARFSATARRYRYLVSTHRSAIFSEIRDSVSFEPDFSRLKECASTIVGEHDFSAFCVSASRKDNNNCTVGFSRWFRWGNLYSYEIRANRFLHSMVRSLVGCMLNVANPNPDANPQNLTVSRFADMLTNYEGKRAPFVAPAKGLYLVSVHYARL